MSKNYDAVLYSVQDKNIISNFKLTDEDEKLLIKLKSEFQSKSFYPIIEDIYKLYRSGYSTSYLAEVYNVSIRQIQRILKDMGLTKELVVKNISTPAKSEKTVKKTKPAASTLSPFSEYYLLPERLREFLNYLEVIKAKSPNTVEGYKIDLTIFFKFMQLYRRKCPGDMEFADIPIDDIDDAFIKTIKLTDLYAYLSYVEKNRGNSAYARARKVASLKSFFRYLYTRTKILEENPAADLETPKTDKRNPIYLTLSESKELLEAVDDTYRHSKRDFCIITLFLNCGLRLSELCSIDISKIKGDILSVVGKGNKERTVYLNKACIRAIEDYLPERNSMEILDAHKDALFISERKRRISKRNVELVIEKYIAAAGLDSTKYTPHKLRHTAATLMYKHGNVDIRSLQKILGHENISTTQIYTHVDDEKLREAVNLNPLNEIE